MVVGSGERHVATLEHLERRRDVEHRESVHAIPVVDREPVGDARTTVVADEMEALEAERSHYLDHVLRHRPLRVIGVIGQPARFGRLAVTAEVGAHDRVTLREARRDLVPAGVRLGVAVKQQHRLAVASTRQVDARVRRADEATCETGEQTGRVSRHSALKSIAGGQGRRGQPVLRTEGHLHLLEDTRQDREA